MTGNDDHPELPFDGWDGPRPDPDRSPDQPRESSSEHAPEPEDYPGADLVRAELERLSRLSAEEEAAEDELARLELEWHSVHQEVADAAARLEEAKAQRDELIAATARVSAEHAVLAGKVDAATEEDKARLDAALAELMRLSSGRHLAEAELAAASSEVDALREEYAAQEAMVAQLELAVAAARNRRRALENERQAVEAAVAAETSRLGELLERLNRTESERTGTERAVLEQAALAEAAAVLDAAAALEAADRRDRADRADRLPAPAEERVLVGAGAGAGATSRVRWSSTASWNAAFALLSVLVVVLGFQTLTSDSTPTEAFCAEAPQLDVTAAREALQALAAGARPGTAFATFEQGRYAYTTTSQVDPDVRAAADALERAHAEVVALRDDDAPRSAYRRAGQAVFDADDALRRTCSSATE